jgi:hypothetical protein
MKTIVAVEAGSGIGVEADWLRLSPDRQRHRSGMGLRRRGW